MSAVAHALFPEVDHNQAVSKHWLEPGKPLVIDGLPVVLQTTRQQGQHNLALQTIHQGCLINAPVEKPGFICFPFGKYPVIAPRAIEYSDNGWIARVFVEVLYPFADQLQGGSDERKNIQ